MPTLPAGIRSDVRGAGRTTAPPKWRSAGQTDPGLVREVNEDRFYVDDERGVLMVIDGLGGQAAGGRAADTALAIIRSRLERSIGRPDQRLREAITFANNEIHRQAATRAEWNGMACVLTVVIVDGDRAVVGHVGDSRLYLLRGNGIEKVTKDHSPVGEREDALEISEADAMRHPRRNEVYRDVGSERHDADDPDFIEVCEVPFQATEALLACSDGLTDLLPASSISRIVARYAGEPKQVVRALVDAANDAGGKDNITVVYVEREHFAAAAAHGQPDRPRPFRTLLHIGLAIVLAAGVVLLRTSGIGSLPVVAGPQPETPLADAGLVVAPGGSIAEAIAGAAAGSSVIVEPGEYRERLVLRDGIRVVSRVPRGATLRLPGAASEGEAAVTAIGPMTAELNGFRIVGDAATPLGTGIVIRGAAVSIVNVEITGAARAALDISGGNALVIGSDIRENPGMALAVRSDASPRVTHNLFSRNALSSAATAWVLIEAGAHPSMTGNVFEDPAPRIVAADERVRAPILQSNWFVGARRSIPPSGPSGLIR
jgi:PPM family protein phosphatase